LRADSDVRRSYESSDTGTGGGDVDGGGGFVGGVLTSGAPLPPSLSTDPRHVLNPAPASSRSLSFSSVNHVHTSSSDTGTGGAARAASPLMNRHNDNNTNGNVGVDVDMHTRDDGMVLMSVDDDGVDGILVDDDYTPTLYAQEQEQEQEQEQDRTAAERARLHVVGDCYGGGAVGLPGRSFAHAVHERGFQPLNASLPPLTPEMSLTGLGGDSIDATAFEPLSPPRFSTSPPSELSKSLLQRRHRG
jgi:hypothetical protein